jgi:hypothetical protein
MRTSCSSSSCYTTSLSLPPPGRACSRSYTSSSHTPPLSSVSTNPSRCTSPSPISTPTTTRMSRDTLLRRLPRPLHRLSRRPSATAAPFSPSSPTPLSSPLLVFVGERDVYGSDTHCVGERDVYGSRCGRYWRLYRSHTTCISRMQDVKRAVLETA